MVTKKVIESLYRQYKRPPVSTDELNLGLLFDYALENHGITVDENNLCIGSVGPSSPFSTIPLRHINEIVEFENVLAIVLLNSIIFLNKNNSDVNVHLRMDSSNLWKRIKRAITG